MIEAGVVDSVGYAKWYKDFTNEFFFLPRSTYTIVSVRKLKSRRKFFLVYDREM